MNSIAVVLQHELEKRVKRNPAFSLRAFAKYLNISPATLSQVISQKRNLSMKKGAEILNQLGFSPSEQLNLIADIDKKNIETQKFQITEDKFKLISEWFYLAILSLGELPNAKADPRHIAKRLNITVAQANIALQRLERLSIIKIENGFFKQIHPPFKTTDDIPSNAIKTYHMNVLNLAIEKLETVDVKEREYSAVTMAINSKNIEKAKEITRKYKKELSKILETGKPDRVYHLSIQLFPMDTKES